MSEKFIIMTPESVRAILDGRKTQTRRVIKPQPDAEGYVDAVSNIDDPIKIDIHELLCLAAYKPGDILWVRETWLEVSNLELKDANGYYYKATIAESVGKWIKELGCKWRSPIHMPRSAARIFLRVTGVRAERVRDITDADCVAEGIAENDLAPIFRKDCPPLTAGRPSDEIAKEFQEFAGIRSGWQWAYWGLWDSINAHRDKGAYAWEKNPYVWVYDFERIEAPK